MSSPTRPLVVTTSWDDGGVLDLRMADLLAEHGMRGTFYVPVRWKGDSAMSEADLQSLSATGMEIGGHTFNHVVMTSLSKYAAWEELTTSKDYLEQLTGNQVASFCYPKGRFSRRLPSLVKRAGYDLARTTQGLRVDTTFDPYLMPVTVQMYPHQRREHLTHAVKERNVRGLFSWLTILGGEASPERLALKAFDRIRETGGILHLWGHSWEVERFDLWSRLDGILRAVSGDPNVVYLTNREALTAAQQANVGSAPCGS